MLDDKYGVTPTGFLRKRLDEITDELHTELSAGFGIDTRHNPKSFLNVLVVDFADKIAELWEVAEQCYNSQVPSTAEGVSLDRVAQLGGSVRSMPTSSVYTILCTGDNGTVIPIGTRIASDTNPAVELVNTADGLISLNDCVAAEIATVGSYGAGDKFTLSVDSHKFEITLLDGQDPIEALAEAMDDESYVNVKTERQGTDNEVKSIVLTFDESVPRKVLISSNLNAVSVTSLISFATAEQGDFMLPKNAVTRIISAVSGLKSITNLADYVKGRDRESDSEFRRSYLEKIFIRSRTMLESIKSAILANCNGVESVSGFENDTNEWDRNGCCRAPHSVEMVVIGGDPEEIAKQIFATKAAGINTSHCDGLTITEANKDYGIEVEVEDDYGKPVTVRFSRPVPLYYKVNITVDAATNEQPAANTFDLIKEIVMDSINALNPGDDLVPQQYLAELYRRVPGVLNYEFAIKLKDSTGESVAAVQGLSYNKVARCADKDDITISYRTGS